MAFPGMPPMMPAYPGAVPYVGAPQAGAKGGIEGKGGYGGKGKFSKGGGMKGFGKGKRGGKGGKSKGKGDDEDGEDGDAAEGEETERGPRIRKDEPPIVKAQREARERAEADILKYIQGRWKDAADESIIYTVEGNTCSVSNKSTPEGRVFHNRLSMYGVEFCWNARRFWHDLNVKALKEQGEPDAIEKVEWNPGKTSPAAEQIIWLRAPPEEEPEKVDATDDGQAETAAATSAEECSGPAADTTDAGAADATN